MRTKHLEPDVDTGREQEQRRPKASRNRQVGAFAMAAAIGLVAAACTRGTRDGQTPAAYPADPKAEEVATGFVKAFGAFDGEQAITYLADGAYLEMDVSTPEGVPVFTSFLEAQGYEQILVDPCRVTGTSASGTAVGCRFDWHAIRSDEIGLGPYPGSWDLTVREGEIVSVSLHWEFTRFSSQMWEPFAEWVSDTYPEDFQVMYTGGGTNFSLTEQSIRLWGQHTREYVRMTIATMAENGEVDYVIDLKTGEMNPLPRAILRSLGPDLGRGPYPESPGQYAASPDGSRLAYVGTGDDGSPQIFIAGVDGTGVHQVTHEPIGATSPAWSPNGTRIAYCGYGSVDAPNIFVLELATGQAKQVTDESPIGCGLQFTPDGSSILFTRGDGTWGELRTVPVTGGKSALLFDPEARGFGHTGEGSLSPDGSLVTFMGHRIGGGGALRFVTNADGTDWRSIGSCISNPAGTWSPDGSRIVCGPNGDLRGIRVKDVATGHTTRVAQGGVAIWLDGHTLLVEV